MITADNLLLIVNAVRWPVVVLLLGIVFLLRFAPDISELFKRVQRAKYPGGEAFFVYGEAPTDKLAQEQPLRSGAESVAKPEQPEGSAIKWRNSGNLFWLGHDLVWTIDVLLRGGPREHIVHGLRQSLHHLRSLGFVGTPLGPGTFIESKLAELKANAESSLEKDWIPLQRNDYTRELAALIRAIGDRAEANQPDFEPGPKE